MYKVCPIDDQPELVQASGQMVRLIEDRVKSAASEVFPRSEIAKFAPPDDKFLLHVTAMGADEHWGPNRNGDGFPEAALKEYHPTFVKMGTFFREHRNRDPKTQGIGHIKASAYNPAMRRVELLLWGDKEKAAEEYAMVKAGKELSVSMACRLPWDECSCCHNKAASLAVYCDHLKNSMGKYLPEFRKYAYALNKEKLKFFDLSRVGRPADRIAYYLESMLPFGDLMQKAASSGLVIPGASWADFYQIGRSAAAEFEGRKRAVLEKLAAAERWVHETGGMVSPQDPRSCFYSHVAARAFGEQLEPSLVDGLRDAKPAAMFRKLASVAAPLPFDAFAAYVTGRPLAEVRADPVVKEAAALVLPSIFQRLLSCGCDQDMAGQFDAGSRFEQDCMPDDIDRLLDKAAERVSCAHEPVKRRVMQVTIIKMGSARPPVTAVTPSDEAVRLGELYGAYKVASLADAVTLGAAGAEDTDVLLWVAQNMNALADISI